MRRYVLALALFGAAALVAGSLAADEPKKDEKKDAKALTKKEVGKLMKDTHHGDKSPHVRTVAELKKDAPDWVQLAKDAKAFGAMGDAFKGVQLGYSSPEGYIKSSTAFTKATGDKDKKAATEAFTGLTKSCAACHFYGGVGGTIK
jgi:hypothetical protein